MHMSATHKHTHSHGHTYVRNNDENAKKNKNKSRSGTGYHYLKWLIQELDYLSFFSFCLLSSLMNTNKVMSIRRSSLIFVQKIQILKCVSLVYVFVIA